MLFKKAITLFLVVTVLDELIISLVLKSFKRLINKTNKMPTTIRENKNKKLMKAMPIL